MKPNTPRTLQEKEPNVARAAVIFGVVLASSLIVGLMLARHEDPEVVAASGRTGAAPAAAEQSSATIASAWTAPQETTPIEVSADALPTVESVDTVDTVDIDRARFYAKAANEDRGFRRMGPGRRYVLPYQEAAIKAALWEEWTYRVDPRSEWFTAEDLSP